VSAGQHGSESRLDDVSLRRCCAIFGRLPDAVAYCGTLTRLSIMLLSVIVIRQCPKDYRVITLVLLVESLSVMH
jgi:hypothetical protein